MKKYRIYDNITSIVIGYKRMPKKRVGDIIYYYFLDKQLNVVKHEVMYQIEGVFEDTLYVKEINFKQLESKIDSEIKEATEKVE